MKNFLQLLLLLLFTVCISYAGKSQVDSMLQTIDQLPAKYISQIDNKIEKYSTCIIGKTEKTLAKLSRWENKIHSILQKVNPEVAQRLFGNNQNTFNTLLQKIREGKAITENYKAKYDEYRDQLTTSLKYIDEQKDKFNKNILQPISETKKKLNKLEEDISNTEAVEQFIKERKRQLIDEAIKHIGKSKYLSKINKEAYYYAETLRNYKDIFSDPKKAEQAAMALLSKIPAFKNFVNKNSQLAGLFAFPVSFGGLSGGGSIPVVNGLASRASFQQYVQNNIPALTTINPLEQIQQQLSDINSVVSQWKNKLNSVTGSPQEMPDFTPNTQKTKTFKERLEYGTELQFGKGQSYMPATSDVALKLGYKLNDKSSAGIGVNYKMGLGNGWNNIRLSSQGVGFRTYLKWKLKKGLDIQGGGEWNYMLQFKNIEQLKNSSGWQQSALLGLNKSYKLGKKLKGNIQVLYDFLYNRNLPKTQPLVFRFGYGL